MIKAIKETNIKGLKLVRRGKVRDVYDLGDCLLMVATDRISAFDVVLPDPIPGKGIMLNLISNFWFRQLKNLIPNHIISEESSIFGSIRPGYAKILNNNADLLQDRAVIVEKCTPLPIECIVRGYISGSAWKSYKEDGTV